MPMVSQCSPICVDTTRVSLESPDAVRSNYSAAVLNCVKFAPIFDPKSCHLSLQYKLPVRRVWSDCRRGTWLWGQVWPGCQQGLPARLLHGWEQLRPGNDCEYHCSWLRDSYQLFQAGFMQCPPKLNTFLFFNAPIYFKYSVIDVIITCKYGNTISTRTICNIFRLRLRVQRIFVGSFLLSFESCPIFCWKVVFLYF